MHKEPSLLGDQRIPSPNRRRKGASSQTLVCFARFENGACRVERDMKLHGKTRP